MVNLVRDNKVLTRKIFHNLKNWLTYTRVSIYGSCSPCFMTNFCKINSVYRMYSYVYFKHIPDDSFIIIDDKDKVLIGVDFDKIPYNNLYIEDSRSNSLEDVLHVLALEYFNNVMSKVTDDIGSYTKLVKELKDVFRFVIDKGINSGKNDELASLLGMYNKSTPELSDERDRLLDCIARYLDKQLSNAVNDLLSRVYIRNAEIQGRDRVLLLANLDFKKNRFTMYNSLVSSAKWKILKGAKNNPMSFDLSELVNSKGNFKTRYIEVDFSFRNVDEYKNNTLYLI